MVPRAVACLPATLDHDHATRAEWQTRAFHSEQTMLHLLGCYRARDELSVRRGFTRS